MFYYLYVLYSTNHKRFYVGCTENLKNRLEQHNQGETYWTKRYKPWTLLYFEGYRSKLDAMKREKQLKRFAKGFAQLKTRLSDTLKSQR